MIRRPPRSSLCHDTPRFLSWLVGRSGKVVAQGGVVDNPAVLHRGAWRTGSYCGRPARVRLNRSGSLWLDDFVRLAPCELGRATSELQSRQYLVCRLLLEKNKELVKGLFRSHTFHNTGALGLRAILASLTANHVLLNRPHRVLPVRCLPTL